MAYTQIQPGQKDWLTKLNDMLKGNSFNSKLFPCTMMNGATGWGNELVLYNDDIYIARVNAWFVLPAGNLFVDFMDNPMSSISNFDNTVLNQSVTLESDKTAAAAGYGRVTATVMLDNKTAWGVYGTEGSSHTYNKSSYNGRLNIVWIGNRNELSI